MWSSPGPDSERPEGRARAFVVPTLSRAVGPVRRGSAATAGSLACRCDNPSVGDELRNPFRSEADAFRLLLIIGAAVVVITLAGLLGGPWVGVPVALLLIGAGIRAAYRWLRQGIENPDDDEPDAETLVEPT